MSCSDTISRILLLTSVLLLKTSVAAASCVPNDCAALGYTKSKSDCGTNPALQCPFDSSKYYCPACSGGDVVNKPTPVTCYVGNVLYSDKKCYNCGSGGGRSCTMDFVPGEVPIGVVVQSAYGTKKGLAVAFKTFSDTTVSQGSNGSYVLGSCSSVSPSSGNPCSSNRSGKANTQIVIGIENIGANGGTGSGGVSSVTAFKNASSYTTQGTVAGEWFLPTMQELYVLYKEMGDYDTIKQNICSGASSSCDKLEDDTDFDNCWERFEKICNKCDWDSGNERTVCTSGQLSLLGKIWSSTPAETAGNSWIWDTSKNCWTGGLCSLNVSNTAYVLPFIEIP